jgi:hypothetical protein
MTGNCVEGTLFMIHAFVNLAHHENVTTHLCPLILGFTIQVSSNHSCYYTRQIVSSNLRFYCLYIILCMKQLYFKSVLQKCQICDMRVKLLGLSMYN